MEAETRHGTRQRRNLIALVVALVIVAVGCSATDANNAVSRYADNAGHRDINSGDNGPSLDLGDGRRLSMYNDPYTGPLRADGTRQRTHLVNNALVVWNTNNNTFQTHLGPDLNGLPTARFRPSDPSNFYWIGTGVVQGNHVLIQANERRASDWSIVNNVVLTLNKSNLSLVRTDKRPATSSAVSWSGTILEFEGYYYIYGVTHPPRPDFPIPFTRTVLARVAPGQFANWDAWRYWTGSGWSASEGAAKPLVDDTGKVLNYYLVPKVMGDRIVMLGFEGNAVAGYFRLASSTHPTAPVTLGGTYVPPEVGQICPGGRPRSVYAVHAHSGGAADKGLWSYSRHCWWPIPGTTESPYARDYRPRFIEFGAGSFPTPCPVLAPAATQKFVRAIYADFPRRSAGAAEVNYWTDEIATKRNCRSKLVSAIAKDGGYLGGVVDTIYQSTLDRAPTPDARAWRISNLQSGAETSTDIMVSALSSEEFFTKAGGTNAGFVDRLYPRILGHAPSAADRTYWANRAASHGRSVVAREIYQSQASRQRRVVALGQHFLGRTFSGNELTYWTTRLGESGRNDVTISRDLASSEEYFTRAQSRF